MAFNATDFADDTDFERFALERLGPHRVHVGEPGAIFHYEANPSGGGRSIISVGGGAAVGAQAREELRQSLRPLGFGAAYKVLDMLVEHVLRANGVTAVRWFAQKTKALATRPASLPVPLDARPELWDRIAPTYIALQDARHAVTHRRAQVTPTGELEVYDENRALTDTIAGAELAAFAAATHTLAEIVIDGDSDPRRVNIVTWHLNELQSRHGLPLLPATDPDAGRRILIMDLVKVDQGLLRFDLARARQVAAGQPPGLWDLQLRDGERIFAGRLEEAPTGVEEIDFHPASPPAWLSEQVT